MGNYFPEVMLEWDDNGEPDFWCYRVWVTKESGGERKHLIGKVRISSIVVRNLPNGIYYFTVTARDKSGNESPHSDEVEIMQQGVIYSPPDEPTGLKVGGYLFEKGSNFEFEKEGDFEFE